MINWKRFFEEHFAFKRAVENYTNPVDDPKNSKFMNDACDSWEALGNNGAKIQPEDCDVDEASFENHK